MLCESKWHFPSCSTVATLPPLMPVLIINFTTQKYLRISSWKEFQVMGRAEFSGPARRWLHCTRGLILSGLFGDRIEIPKGKMLNLLTDNKPVILLPSVNRKTNYTSMNCHQTLIVSLLGSAIYTLIPKTLRFPQLTGRSFIYRRPPSLHLAKLEVCEGDFWVLVPVNISLSLSLSLSTCKYI